MLIYTKGKGENEPKLKHLRIDDRGELRGIDDIWETQTTQQTKNKRGNRVINTSANF